MARDTKRQNFNITPEQEAEIAWLREAIDAPTTKDAILRSVRVMATLAKEVREGRSIYLAAPGAPLERLLIPDLEPAGRSDWKYLAPRPSSGRKQLYYKGRRLPAFRVWMDMQVNGRTPQEAAENWDLPLEAVQEAIRYCELNQELLGMEADEEKRLLLEAGVDLGPGSAD